MSEDIIDSAIAAAKSTGRGTARGKGGLTRVIHFVRDGIILDRRQWFSGMELEYTEGSPEAEATKDRKGNTWLSIVDDEQEQLRRYNEVYMRPGPYRGKRFAQMTERELSNLRETGNPIVPLTVEDAEKAEANRRFKLGVY